MSEEAIFDTTEALRGRIAGAIGGPVHVGPPLRDDINANRASLFLFHIEVNAEMRNELRFTTPAGPATEPAESRDAIPLDLRFLITVFGTQEAHELRTLGRIVQVLQARPTLSGGSLGGQVVRVTPEFYSMEELSRVWGLFPQDAYRTSIVYLASPVIVEAPALPVGPPVKERRSRTGILDENSSGLSE